MKILLTGHRGRLGPTIAQYLRNDGHEVAGFDLFEGDDVLDAAAVERAARGAQAIVHVAGLAGDRAGTPAQVMAVNLIGTSNVLLAAEAQKVGRVVHLSSGRALGMLDRVPDYLPMDDDHRGRPPSAYGLAKWLSEEMCAAFTERTGIDTISLRAVAVFDEAGYRQAIASATQKPGTIWHLGVHIDIRDVAAAVVAAVTCPSPGHARLLLCAPDIADRQPTLEAVRMHFPDVEWRGGSEYRDDPYKSLVDTRRAQRVLGWQARHPWPGRVAA